MPITAYLRIDDIAGESQRAGHEEEIDIHDMRWGLEQNASATAGRGRTRSRADMKPLVVRKFADAASVYLAEAVKQGRSFPDMVLTVRKDDGEAQFDYLVITMQNVVVTSFQIASYGDGSVDYQLAEEVEFSFEKVIVKYTKQSADGSATDHHEVTLNSR